MRYHRIAALLAAAVLSFGGANAYAQSHYATKQAQESYDSGVKLERQATERGDSAYLEQAESKYRDAVAADLHLADRDDRVLFFELPGSKLIWLADRHHRGDTFKQLDLADVDGGLADRPEDRFLLTDDLLDRISLVGEKLANGMFLSFGYLFLENEYHEETLEGKGEKIKR